MEGTLVSLPNGTTSVYLNELERAIPCNNKNNEVPSDCAHTAKALHRPCTLEETKTHEKPSNYSEPIYVFRVFGMSEMSLCPLTSLCSKELENLSTHLKTWAHDGESSKDIDFKVKLH